MILEEKRTASAAQRLLEVSNLTVAFEGPQDPVRVVDNVSFHIDRGRVLGMVGESGSGKSITSLAIMGLLPPAARVEGSVKFEGKELVGLPQSGMTRIRGDRIAMVFQDPLSSLNPYYRVGLQIAETYLAHRGGSRKHARAMAIEAMDRVRIPDPKRRSEQYPHQFSGGMRQRIMIAIALCCEPELIIADEPTTALDVTVQAQILDLLRDVQRETGAGMLFITHDLAVVSQVADDMHVLWRGVTVEQGSAEEVISRPQSDYTQHLLAATPRMDDVITLADPATIRANVRSRKALSDSPSG